MKIAYFDCFSGISGDMALGALLDCGVPLDKLKQGLASLPVAGWEISAQPILQVGIHACSVSIALDGQTDDQELAAAPKHDHHHDHDHSHDHEHHHEHDHSHPHFHGRSMAEIRKIIEASELSERVKRDALEIFGRIAVAEAKLHHSTPDEIHFHEIGGIDSLLDICGVAWCLEYLGIEKVFCSALPHSSGTVQCAHGQMPVPAPATLEILQGATWTPTGIIGELVTPTGAGIVAALAQGFGPMPELKIEKTGIGAGKKSLGERPNILRVTIGDAVGEPAQKSDLAGLEWRDLALIESNIDDMNPELFDAVYDRLFASGALDVWLQPIQMKKNRPAFLLGVLGELEAQNALIEAVLRETTTLGVRVQTVRRAALPREIRQVDTPHGAIRVKIVQWNHLRRATPEYEDVKRLAHETNLPAREIYQSAVLAANVFFETKFPG